MTKTAAQTAHEARNAASKAAAQERKADRRLDHVARNRHRADRASQTRDVVAELKAFDHLRLQDETAAAAAKRKAVRIANHVERNADTSIEAAKLRIERQAQDERAALASATLAFAEAIEARYGIASNDNAALRKAA